MSRFGSDPLAFLTLYIKILYAWDIGAPQPAMAALIENYPPANPVLDLGCGSGDLAICLLNSVIKLSELTLLNPQL